MNKVAEEKSNDLLEKSKFVTSVWEENLPNLIPDETKREKVKETVEKAEEVVDNTTTKPKKRGRPKGSKNKPKNVDTETTTTTTETTETTEADTESMAKELANLSAAFDKNTETMSYSQEASIYTSEEVKEEVLQTAIEMSFLYDHALVIWDNHEIVEENGVVFAPLDAVVNLPASDLIKAGAERTIVNEFYINLPQDILNFIYDQYKQFYKSTDEIENKAIWATLYDKSFYWYMLNRADKRVVNVLKVLDNIANTVSQKQTNTTMFKEYNLALRRIRNNIGPALALYFCNNPYITFENVTVFSPEQIAYIQEHRFNAIMAERFVHLDVNDPEFLRYKNVIANRINSLKISEYDKKLYYDRLNSISNIDRQTLIYALDRDTHATYFGKYDDYYYKKGNDVKTSRLNTFLMAYGISYNDLVTGKFMSNPLLYNAIVEDLGNDYTTKDLYNWITERFEQFTYGNYTIEIQDGSLPEGKDLAALPDKDKLAIRIINAYNNKDYLKIKDKYGNYSNYLQHLVEKYGVESYKDLEKTLLDKNIAEDYINYRIVRAARTVDGTYELSDVIEITDKYTTPNAEVIELETFHSKVGDMYSEYNLDTLYTDTLVTNVEATSILSDMLVNVNEVDLTYLTVNDIINFPDKYLTSEVIDDILKRSKILNNVTVQQYLNRALLSRTAFEYSIVLDANNEYVVSKLSYALEFFKDDLREILDDEVNSWTRSNKYISKVVGKYDHVDYEVEHLFTTWDDIQAFMYSMLYSPDDYVYIRDRNLYINCNYQGYLQVNDTITGEVRAISMDDVKEYFDSGTLVGVNVVKNYSDIPITEFINADKLIGELKNIKIKIEEMSPGTYGHYDDDSFIHINESLLTSATMFFNTVVHEFQHAVQNFNNFAPGGNTGIIVTESLFKDVIEHVPGIVVYEKYGNIDITATKDNIKSYVYLTLFGEQASRGELRDAPYVESTFTGTDAKGKYVIFAWGNKHYWTGDNSPIVKSDVNYSVDVNKKKERYRSAEELKVDADKGRDYQQRVEKAIELVKQNKKDKKKTYKKDLAQFKLSEDVVNQILSNTYKKSSDPEWELANRYKRLYEQAVTREKARKRLAKNRETDSKERQIFLKDAEGTNLMYWYKANPNWTPQIHPAVRAFVLSATDFKLLDPELVKKIKSGHLTLWDINDFVRDRFIDEKGMNDYTFTELKNAFFKNTPFTKFSQVKRFVTEDVVLKAYAVRSALLATGNKKIANGNWIKAGWNFTGKDSYLNKFADGSIIEDEVKREKYLKAYHKAYDRLTKADILTEKGEVIKDEVLQYEDAKADILLGLLRYFNGDLKSLQYVANNAKAQLMNTIRYNKDFSYIKRKGSKGQSTVSLNQTYDSGDSSVEMGDMVADRVNHFEDAEGRDAYEILSDFAIAYYVALLNEGTISEDEAYTKIQNTRKFISKLDEETVDKKAAFVQTLQDTGVTITEIAIDDVFDTFVDAAIGDTVINIKVNKRNAYSRFRSIVNRLAAHLDKKTFNKLVPNEYKQYFDTEHTYVFKKGSLDNLTAEQIEELIPKLKEISANVRASKRTQSNAKNTAKKQTKTNAKDKNKKTTTEQKYKVHIEEDVYVHSDIEMPEVLKTILQNSFKKSAISKSQYGYFENSRYITTSLTEFLADNATELALLTDADVYEILYFFEHGNVKGGIHTPYGTIQMYLLGYIIEQRNNARRFHLDPEVNREIDLVFHSMSRNAAQELAAVRDVLKHIEPDEIIVTQMMASYGIDVKDNPNVTKLVKAIARFNKHATDKATVTNQNNLEEFTDTVAEIQQVMDNLRKDVLRKFKQGKNVLREDMRKHGVKVNKRNLLKVIDIIEHLVISEADARKLIPDANKLTDKQFKEAFKKLKHEQNTKQLNKIKELLGEDAVEYIFNKYDIKFKADGTINNSKANIKKALETMHDYLFASRHYANDAFDKILKFQKAMMLTAPATIVRNHASNIIIGGFDWTDKSGKRHHVGGLNDLADILGNVFGKKVGKTETVQYNFSKTKVSENTMTFVKNYVMDTGLLDLVGDGLSKYNPYSRNANLKDGKLEDNLSDMIIKSMMVRIYGDNTYTHDQVNTVVNTIFKLHSDDKYIKNTALRLIGKMLEFDQVDLSKGMTQQVLNVIASAYVEASYEYMHRTNVLSNWINGLKYKSPKMHFCLNLAKPFLASQWNWFVEYLQYNPVTMVHNLIKLANLEKYVYKMDEAKRKGDTQLPSSRFAEMLIKRDIGKGVIGTVLLLLGAVLRHWGVIEPDDDDEMKLKVGDTYIDFSNMYGATSILVGAQLASPKEGDWTKVIEAAFNQQFEDFALTSIMNTFKYDDTPYEYFTSLPTTIISSFVPNVWKQAVKLTNNHEVVYSKGFLGNIQYLAMQSIPFIEYAMPKYIDPYTGEWKEKYSVPYVHQLATLLGSPLSFETLKKSDVELAFDDAGINKQPLKGNYKDIGQVDVNVLNEYYGKLNNKTVSQFINNKVKYKVEIDDGVYRELYYRQMNDEQIKSVLTSITSKNANYAKIYTWTQMGGKYYCSSSKRKELLEVGITKNVYIGKENKFSK